MSDKMFEPLIEVYRWIKSVVPDSFKPGRPHLNFITVHCKIKRENKRGQSALLTTGQDCYMIGLTIIGSIILYPGKTLGYTDSLFFAAGAATQSGLNT